MSHTFGVLRVQNLGRRFGERWVFRRIELELERGQVLTITGPNGCGKSTLLKVLTGLLPANEGTVSWAASWGLAALDAQLYPQLTAIEHLQFVRQLRPGKHSPFDLLTKVGLADAANRPAGQMSSGMKARLKLALALQHDPVVLVLDEPTASLDDSGREIVAAIVAAQLQTGAVVIATNDAFDRRMATHELSLA